MESERTQGLKTNFGELILLFPTPLVKTNIGRSFTKEEMDCILNIPLKPTKVKNNENNETMTRNNEQVTRNNERITIHNETQ